MEKEEYGKFTYILLDDGTYEARIVKYAKTVMVPDSYCGKAVTAVSASPNAEEPYLLKDVLIPEGIERIGRRAFYKCFSLHAVVLPSSLKLVEIDAFSLMGSVEEVYVFDLSSYLSIDFECASANPLRAGSKLYIGNENFSFVRLKIPDDVSRIGTYALSGRKDMVSVTIPESVEYIGEGAFDGCRKLIEIINLSTVDLTGREDVAKVLNITDSGDGSRLTCIDNGFVFYSSDGEDFLVGYEGSESDIVLPDDFFGRSYSVYNHAFEHYDPLMSLTVGRRVNKICDRAFSGCYGLGEIIFPKDGELIEIGESAFTCDEWLGDTTLPDGLVKLAPLAFAYCSLLNRMYIPKSVKEVAFNTFEGCRNLNLFLEAEQAPEGFERNWDACAYTVTFGANPSDP